MTNKDNQPPLLLFEFEMLALLRVSSSTLRRMIRRGDAPAPLPRRPRGRKMWRRVEVENYLATSGKESGDPAKATSGTALPSQSAKA